MVLLVNFETGEEIHADEGQLQGMGIPEGYVILDRISKETLWNLYVQEKNGCRDNYPYLAWRDMTYNEWVADDRPHWICRKCQETFVTIPICKNWLCPKCSEN